MEFYEIEKQKPKLQQKILKYGFSITLCLFIFYSSRFLFIQKSTAAKDFFRDEQLCLLEGTSSTEYSVESGKLFKLTLSDNCEQKRRSLHGKSTDKWEEWKEEWKKRWGKQNQEKSYQIEIEKAPDGLRLNNDKIMWNVPPDAEGSYEVTLLVKNFDSEKSLTKKITINVTGHKILDRIISTQTPQIHPSSPTSTIAKEASISPSKTPPPYNEPTKKIDDHKPTFTPTNTTTTKETYRKTATKTPSATQHKNETPTSVPSSTSIVIVLDDNILPPPPTEEVIATNTVVNVILTEPTVKISSSPTFSPTKEKNEPSPTVVSRKEPPIDLQIKKYVLDEGNKIKVSLANYDSTQYQEVRIAVDSKLENQEWKKVSSKKELEELLEKQDAKDVSIQFRDSEGNHSEISTVSVETAGYSIGALPKETMDKMKSTASVAAASTLGIIPLASIIWPKSLLSTGSSIIFSSLKDLLDLIRNAFEVFRKKKKQ